MYYTINNLRYFILLILFSYCGALQYNDNQLWRQKASDMVKNQIEGRGIKDSAVIKAMRDTPRHLFIQDNLKDLAYNDGPLPIGEGQTISQPYIVALMTELLQLKGSETILEIGTGSGYQSAILSTLVSDVYSIEIIHVLADRATKTLNKLNYNNVIVKWGDGYKGWPKHAPFDGIIVTAAPEKIPQALIDQLKIGGRLIIPVGSHYQQLKVIIKQSDGIKEETIIPVRFVPMVHPQFPIPDSSYHKSQ